jgi:hypothetical protein
MEAIAAVFHNMVMAELPALNRVVQILRQKLGVQLSAENSAAIPVPPRDALYETHVNRCAGATNIHLEQHLDSCVNSRVQFCRYCKQFKAPVFSRRIGLICLVDLDPAHTIAIKRRFKLTKTNAKLHLPIKFKTISKVVPERPLLVSCVYNQPILQADTRFRC